MHRIDTSTALKDKFGSGKNGYTDGDPSTGRQATDLDADMFDEFQEEICAPIEEAGITPQKGVRNQLLTALKKLFLASDDSRVSNALQKSKNLSDVEDEAKALDNIGAFPAEGGTVGKTGVSTPYLAVTGEDWINITGNYATGSNYQTNWTRVTGRESGGLKADIYHYENIGNYHELAFHVYGGGNEGYFSFRNNGNFNAGGDLNAEGMIYGGKGVTSPGIHISSNGMSATSQGGYAVWNEQAGRGEFDLICNAGTGAGGFILRTVNSDNTVELGRVDITGTGTLNTSNTLLEMSQRVYSPNNPPPIASAAVTGFRYAASTWATTGSSDWSAPSGTCVTGVGIYTGAKARYSYAQILVNGQWINVETVS